MEEALRVFIAELRAQKKEVEKIFRKVEDRYFQIQKEATPERVESLAYQLHNLYCALEDLFKLVAGFFENRVDDSTRYHLWLLKRMTVEIEGLRPALLSEETFRLMNELRAFRHVFRHAYAYELDPERVRLLAEKMPRLRGLFEADFQRFVAELSRGS
ncbi:hypothetical protein [Thermosulfurimonas marina]|uniref:ribonuclease toxin HepT-like protein n=1 Tax=Thermosulfurimonas marina TaxID=2047767 RepID=UPI00144A683D|nr:hypothetical protein [Thermosulfurimonas marina]